MVRVAISYRGNKGNNEVDGQRRLYWEWRERIKGERGKKEKPE